MKRSVLTSFVITATLLSACGTTSENPKDLETVKIYYPEFLVNVEGFDYTFPFPVENAKLISNSNGNANLTVSHHNMTLELSKGKLDQEISKESLGIYKYKVVIQADIKKSDLTQEFQEQIAEWKKDDEYTILLTNYYGSEGFNSFVDKKSADITKLRDQLYTFENEMINNKDVQKLANEIWSSVNDQTSQEEFVRGAFEYFNNHYTYDDRFRQDLDSRLLNPDEFEAGISHLMQTKQGICFHFAYLFKTLLDMNRIENTLVFGNFRGIPDGVTHVWNKVKVNGKWIQIDNSNRVYEGDKKFEKYIAVYETNA